MCVAHTVLCRWDFAMPHVHPRLPSFSSSFSPVTATKPTLCVRPCAVRGSSYASTAFKRIQRCRDQFQVLQGLWQFPDLFEYAWVVLTHGSQLWLLLRPTWAARPDFMDLWPVHGPPRSTGPMLSLMLCHHNLKILNKFWTASPAFSFCTRPCKLCSWSCGLLLNMSMPRLHPDQLVRIPAGGIQAPVLCKLSGWGWGGVAVGSHPWERLV